MTALAANTQRRLGSVRPWDTMAYRVLAATKIYAGSLVIIDSTAAAGWAAPLTFNAAHRFVGIALEEADNTAGASGDILVKVIPAGTLLLLNTEVAGADPEDVGALVYATDDGTGITLTLTSAVPIGTLSFVDETLGEAGVAFRGAGVQGLLA